MSSFPSYFTALNGSPEPRIRTPAFFASSGSSGRFTSLGALVSGTSFLISTLAPGPVSCFFHSVQSLTMRTFGSFLSSAVAGAGAGAGFSPQAVHSEPRHKRLRRDRIMGRIVSAHDRLRQHENADASR